MDFARARKALSPEEEQQAKSSYTAKVMVEVERELMGQIEIFEGRVPTRGELAEHGRSRMEKNGVIIFLWKSLEVVKVIPSKKRYGVTIKTFKLAPKNAPPPSEL